MSDRINIAGQRFGYLVALDPLRHPPGTWRCQCDCGQVVAVPSRTLRKGEKKACCINGHRWKIPKRGGLVRLHPSEYMSWYAACRRCNDPRMDTYEDYGGRGIKMSPRWSTFAAFFKDMGPKPTPKHTIERIDNDKGYFKANCRWATKAEQQRNMRSSVYVEVEGELVLLIDVLKKHNVRGDVVRGRLNNGWSLEDALTVPVRPRAKNKPR